MKSTDNLNPTSDTDIRYSLGEYIRNNEEVLIPYNKKQKNTIRNFKNTYILKDDMNVDEFIDKSKHTRNNLKLFMGILPIKFVKRLKNDIGVDLSNVSLTLNSSYLNHTFKNHGKDGIKIDKNSAITTPDDIKHIADIVQNYDEVKLDLRGQETRIAFRTNSPYENLLYNIVEVSLKNGRELTLKNLMKRKKGIKYNPLVDANAPTLTPNKRAEFNSSNLNISNLDYDVNGIAKDNEWIDKTNKVLNEANRQLVDDPLTVEDIDDILQQRKISKATLDSIKRTEEIMIENSEEWIKGYDTLRAEFPIFSKSTFDRALSFATLINFARLKPE